LKSPSEQKGDHVDYDEQLDGAEQIAQYFTARNRPLRLRIGLASGVSDDLLLPQRIQGYEAICDGIELRVYCLSLDAYLPLKTLIGVAAEVQIVTDQGNLRSLCGVVAEVSQGESDGGFATYQLVLRDALAILDLSANSRIFLKKTELEVVRIVLEDVRRINPALAATFEFEIDTALAQRESPVGQQIMQCNESTGAFIRRLLKRRGIAWFFRPGRAAGTAAGDSNATPAHTMVLFHDARRLKQSPAARVRFHRDGATEERDAITAWSGVRTLRAGRVTRFSWDYGNPRATSFMTASAGSNADQGYKGNRLAGALEDYAMEPPHVRDNYEDLCGLAQQAMARADFESKCYYAEGCVRDCGAGEYFCLDGHAVIDRHPEAERNFVVVSRHIVAQNNLPKELDARVERLFSRNGWNIGSADFPTMASSLADIDDLRFIARMTCVRRDVRFVPAFDSRTDLPRAMLQTAIVVGPSGEEVFCDALGRVKVRFSGMREEDHAHAEGAGASDSPADSAWVRVASNWAGTAGGSGAYFGSLGLPRAGSEVLIDFLGGDPDKPVIIGQLYNGAAQPPGFGEGGLPGNRYLSGLKSREIRGQRANQLRLDDTPGQISAQLASDHERSELNLGWLSQRRSNGAGTGRGEGAELTTDAQLALRGGKGMLISAWQRLNGGGKQLDRQDYLALMEDCVALFRTLGQYAAQFQGLSSDEQAQGEAQQAVKQWERCGAAAIGVTAPDGISFATSKAIVSYAAANIDSVAQRNLQLAAGQRVTVNAGKGISLFAQQEGLHAIAHNGTLLMQSQHGSTQLESAQDIKISAKGRVTIMAEELVLVNSGGAYVHLKGGSPEIGGPGPITIKTDGHNWNGPASKRAELPTFGESDFGRTPRLLRGLDGNPVEGIEVQLERDGDGLQTGQTDAQGQGDLVKTGSVQELTATFHTKR
jgi:type VI secretion system secreted protein VgrG